MEIKTGDRTATRVHDHREIEISCPTPDGTRSSPCENAAMSTSRSASASATRPVNQLAPAYPNLHLYPLYYPLIPRVLPAPDVSARTDDKLSRRPVIIPDCLEHVFRYLDSRDKGRAARVCRLWRDTCYRRSVWKGSVARLSLSRNSDSILHSVQTRGVRKVRLRDHRCDVERVTRIFASLQHLDISGCYYTNDETLQRAFWCKLPELNCLDLSYCSVVTDAGVSNAVEKCSNLRSLSLRGCPNVRLNNGLKRALKQCSTLNTLNLSGCKQLFYPNLLGLFGEDGVQTLEELNLRDCDHICNLCLKYISSSLASSLKSLDLSFCISMTDQGLEAVASGLSCLEVLKLQSVDNITSRGIEHVASKCSRLKLLDIGFCDWVRDECLEQISRGKVANSLQELNIKCTHVSDEGIRAISESLHQLRCLVIGQCTLLTDKSVEHVKTNLLELMSIDCYGCCFSRDAIISLQKALPNLLQANRCML